MPNRILFLVSAMLASLALPLVPNAAYAADCLASPGKDAPSGGHWRYHIERGTGNKCWYLAGETAKSGQTNVDQTKSDDVTADNAKAASDDADSAASVPPRPATKIRPSLERAAASPPDRPRPPKPAPQALEQAPAGNARAEFIESPRNEQPPATPQAQPGAPAAQLAAPPAAASQGSVATRWPSPAGIASADSAAPAAADASPAATAAAPQPTAQLQPAVSTDQAPPAAATDQPAAQPAGATDGPDYLLYALIITVIAFASVVGFAALRFFAEWWRDWRDERRWRRSVPSYTVGRGASMLAVGEVAMELAPMDDAAMPRSRGQRTAPAAEPPRRLEDEIDQIEQLLALTREAGREADDASWQHDARRGRSLEIEMPRDAAE